MLANACRKAEIKSDPKIEAVWLINTEVPHLPLYIVVTETRTKTQ